MNSLISSALLYYPKQEVSFDTVKAITKNLYQYINEKGCKTYISVTPQNYDINQAVLNLGFKVRGNPLDKKTGGAAIINMKMKDDSELKTLALSYYGN